MTHSLDLSIAAQVARTATNATEAQAMANSLAMPRYYPQMEHTVYSFVDGSELVFFGGGFVAR